MTRDELDAVRPAPRMRSLGSSGAALPSGPALPNGPAFSSDEEAAKFYLRRLLHRDRRPLMRSLEAAQPADTMGDVRLESTHESGITHTRVLRFRQTHASIPVFGSHVAVELGDGRRFVSADAEVARPDAGLTQPKVTEAEALASVAKLAGVPEGSLAPADAELYYFHDDVKERWHLAYLFRNVPAAPGPGADRPACCHGLHAGPPDRSPLTDYLVDTQDASVLYHYRSARAAAAANAAAPPVAAATPADLPRLTQCKGVDELGQPHDFWGSLHASSNAFELYDPLRKVQTFDFAFKDLNAKPLPWPDAPIRNAAADFQSSHTAAVSAHVNAVRVQDFFRTVLMRDSIDGKGMTLVSLVNCVAASEAAPPEWGNAAWWQNRMWYGQVKGAGGKLRSFSSFLDIIGHELTHGVTEFTAGLVYQGESGALNESFSDIFGVIINNWVAAGPGSDVGGWVWEIGRGFGHGGGPLRDFRDPRRVDYLPGKPYPDHMNDYVVTSEDYGGVHINSGIHNKAAYNVLTAADANGRRLFRPSDVAVLYYLALLRLSPTATFRRALAALLDAANVYYAGDPAEREAKRGAIRAAYAGAGIAL